MDKRELKTLRNVGLAERSVSFVVLPQFKGSQGLISGTIRHGFVLLYIVVFTVTSC